MEEAGAKGAGDNAEALVAEGAANGLPSASPADIAGPVDELPGTGERPLDPGAGDKRPLTTDARVRYGPSRGRVAESWRANALAL